MSQVTFSKSSVGTNDSYLHPHSSVVIFPCLLVWGVSVQSHQTVIRCLAKSSEILEHGEFYLNDYALS